MATGVGPITGGARGARSLAVAGVACLVAAAAMSVAAARGGLFPGDAAVMLLVQANPAASLDAAARALSWLGLWPQMSALGLAVAAWVWHTGARPEAAVVVAAVALHPVNWLLKLLVGRARPTANLATVVEQAAGLGFPSGHAFGAMLLFATLAGVLAPRVAEPRQRWAVGLGLVGMAILIGWSRVRLGAHWPSDVVGGWLWGGGVALLLLAAAERSPHPRPHSLARARGDDGSEEAGGPGEVGIEPPGAAHSRPRSPG